MKLQSFGEHYARPDSRNGFATLEILLAMTIIVMAISTILPLVSGGQSVSVSSQTDQEALYKAQDLLENARAISRSDFGSVITTSITNDDIYQKQTVVDPTSVTQCGKNVKSNVSWQIDSRLLSASLSTHLGDIATATALGGNCDSDPPPVGWAPPDTWASSNFSLGSPTGMDALNRIVYMTGNGNPTSAENFYIANTNGVAKGTSSGLFITFSNGFKVNARLNDIKVAKLSDGKTYAFVARDTTTNQFQVIDVSDIYNPVSKGLFQLANVSSTGSYPQGWRLFYYDNRVYIVTRFTAGPELHIFDVSNPSSINEIGSGTELGLTVNSFVVTQKNIGGTLYRFAYMATSSDSKELFVINVTNPSSVVEVTGASRNLKNPDYADGNAVFLVGNRLYFGRDSSSPYDLYVFDTTSNPLTVSGGLPILGQADVGTSVIGLAVSGQYAFLATAQVNSEFKVWKSDPNNLTSIYTSFNFPNIVNNGIKYANDWVYLSSSSNDSLRILYNNP